MNCKSEGDNLWRVRRDWHCHIFKEKGEDLKKRVWKT